MIPKPLEHMKRLFHAKQMALNRALHALDVLRAELAAEREAKSAAMRDFVDALQGQGELRAELAAERERVIEECARAMNPMLRSMISRDEAARIIRSLAKGDRDE